VLVPDRLAEAHPELAWAQRFPLVESVQLSGVWVAAREVPIPEWESRCRTPFDYVAPELAANRLLSISDIAALAGVTRQTISTYAARSAFPEPQYRVGGSPVWSAPVVHHWFATRPGQGRGPVAGPERQISTTG
jgi:predicted DNA-binding transcriptional regulator AlpA